MLALVERRESILWFQGLLDQPHVIFLAQRVQCQDRPENGSRFDADEHSRVRPTGNHGPTGRDDQQVQRMLVAPFRWMPDKEPTAQRKMATCALVEDA